MRQSTILSMIGFLTWIAAPVQTFATSWVARQGLSGSQYQAEFNQWTSAPYGLRLQSLSGYEVAGQARYTALWVEEPGPGWSAGHGMTESEFKQADQTNRSNGGHVSWISGFTVGGVRYFNAIWEYHTLVDVASEVGISAGTFAGRIIAYAANGYHLQYASTFTDGGSDAYNGIWVKGGRGTPPHIAFGSTDAQFQTQFNNESAAGYRLVEHSTSVAGSLERHTGVFIKNTFAGWYSLGSLSQDNYEGENANAYYQGYRPESVSAYLLNGALKFNAVWVLNGGMTPDQIEPLNKKVRAYMQQYQIPGLSLAVAKNGRLVYAKGFGYSEMETGDLVNPLNRFRVASVSKPITATAVLRLLDQNAFQSVDQKIFGTGALLGNQYGSKPYSNGEKSITMQHLLHHTTGWQSDGVLWNNAYGTDHDAILSWQLDNVPLSTVPGASYQYQNIDFITAGRVIEHLSGKTYEQFVKEQVLAPSGIDDMELGNPTLAGRKAREVRYYPSGGGDPYVTINPKRMDANGGWIAKPMDLLLLMRRIDGLSQNTDILSSNSWKLMHQGSSANGTYGLGLLLNSSWFGHNGCMDGTISFLVHRNDGLDFAVTCNTRPNADSCAWTLKQVIDDGLSVIGLSDWPDYDLFSSVSTAFDAWTEGQFSVGVRNQPGLHEEFWGPQGDPDHDGISNAMEAYFNLSPFASNSLHFTPSISGNDFVVRWQEPLLAIHHGVQLVAKITADIQPTHWQNGPSIGTVTHGIQFPGIVTRETRLPMNGKPKVFQAFDTITP